MKTSDLVALGAVAVGGYFLFANKDKLLSAFAPPTLNISPTVTVPQFGGLPAVPAGSPLSWFMPTSGSGLPAVPAGSPISYMLNSLGIRL